MKVVRWLGYAVAAALALLLLAPVARFALAGFQEAKAGTIGWGVAGFIVLIAALVWFVRSIVQEGKPQ